MPDLLLQVQLKADGSGLVGEVKLSEKELKKLGKTTKDTGKSADKAGKDMDSFARRTRKTKNAARDLNSVQKNLTRSLLAGAAAFISLRSASKLIDAYRKQEQAVAALDASISSMGRTTVDLSGKLQRLASQIQDEGIIGDEAIIQGQSFLTTYGDITDDLLPRTTRLMADLAAKMRGDVVAAANLLGKASLGMVGDLSRVGISLSDTAKETKDFQLILTEIESQVEGMNKALGATATGGIDQFNNAAGDAQEQLGKLIATTSSPWLRLLSKNLKISESDFNDWQDSFDEGTRSIILGIGGVRMAFFGFEALFKLINLGFKTLKFGLIEDLELLTPALEKLQNLTGLNVAPNREALRLMQADTLTEMQQLAQELADLTTTAENPGTAIIEKLNALQKQFIANRKEADKSTKSITNLNSANADLARLSEKAGKKLEKQAKAFNSVIKEIKLENKLTSALITGKKELIAEVEFEIDARSLINSLTKEMGRTLLPEEADALGDVIRKRAQLNKTLEKNEKQQKKAARALKEQQREAERAADSARELALEPFLNAARGMQDAFTNAFQNLFSGGIKTFGDLAASIKSIFIRMAAELAALGIFRPLAASVLGSFGFSEIASASGLVTGGSSGGGFQIPGLGNLFGNFSSSINAFGSNFLGLANIPPGGIGPIQPGIFGNAGLSGILGAAGLGALGGGLISNLLGGSSTTGSLLGGGGAALGFALGGPVGGVIGSVAGGIFGGLFGEDKDFPFTQANATSNRAIGLRTLDGGNLSQTVTAGNILIDNLQAFAKSIGGGGISFPPFRFGTASGRSAALGSGFFVGGPGGFQKGAQFTNLSEEQFQSRFNQLALENASISGFSGELNKVFRTSAGRNAGDLNKIASDVEFAKQILNLNKTISPTTSAIQEINKLFNEMSKRARSLGLSITGINKARAEEINKIRESEKQLKEAERQRKENELNALRQGESQTASQIRALLQQGRNILGLDQLTSFRESLTFSNLSPLSATQQFSEAQALLNRTASAALSGDTTAIGRFPNIAQQVLGLGRDVFASGPEFAQLFTSVNTTLNKVIGNQEALEATLVTDLDLAIRDTSQDQIDAIKDQTKQLEAGLKEIRLELSRRVA
ncbi:MAG: hypothetical protein FVQ79_00730 [Planctomycetes bacterium]|nr:hypothetical protein [Planctomycetota bacterium]